MESQTCTVGGWGPMFGKKSQINTFFDTFPDSFNDHFNTSDNQIIIFAPPPSIATINTKQQLNVDKFRYRLCNVDVIVSIAEKWQQICTFWPTQ